jgi:hypothetical protein
MIPIYLPASSTTTVLLRVCLHDLYDDIHPNLYARVLGSMAKPRHLQTPVADIDLVCLSV